MTIPDGYSRLTPYLIVGDAPAAIDWYCRVLGGTERMRMPMPDGTVGHAEVVIGDAVLMLADEFPDRDIRGPRSIGGTPVLLSLYVDDVDAVFARAVEAGASALEEPVDKFYGDRSGSFEDPFGHRWSVATHVEDVPPEEMQRRMESQADG